MGAGITITVNAVTAEAAANLAAFVNQTNSGLQQIEAQAKKANQAATVTAGSLKSAARALSGVGTNVAYTASLFAGPQVQAMIYPAMMLGKEIKGVSAAMKLMGISAPVAGVALIGLTLAVWSGAEAWKAYKARAEEAKNATDSIGSQDELTNRLRKQIDSVVARNRLSRETALELKKMMSDAGHSAMSKLNDNSSAEDITRALQQRLAAVADAQSYVRWKLKGLVATEDEITANTKLYELNKKYGAERMEGFEKERYDAEQARLARLQEIEETAKAAGRAKDSAVVMAAYENAREAHAVKMADIAKRESDAEEEKLQAAREYFEEQNKMNDELHEKFMKQVEQEREEKRKAAMDALQNDWRKTDADKFGPMSDLAKPEEQLQLGPDPNSWADQWTSALVRVKNEVGTWKQQVVNGAFNLVSQAANGLGDALTSIVMGTKSAGQAFAQFGTQMLSSFINMIATAVIQAYVAIPILTALGVLSGGATAAQGSAVTMMAMTSAMGGVMGLVGGARERGGPVDAGLMYLVGERGPELMVTGQRGTVIPAQQTADILSRSGSGGGASGSRTLNQNLHLHFDKRELMRALKDDIHAIALSAFGNNRVELGFET